MEEEVRLQKYMADCGIASRRKCEELISKGEVLVNGRIVKELGTKIKPKKDKIFFRGKEVTLKGKKIYILLNKPIGYVTTAKDQFSRATVLDLVKVKERVVPVGRLDMYTSGALILTNDGEFVNEITHPSKKVEKTYTVTVIGIVTKDDIEKLETGVLIDGNYKTKPAKAKILKIDLEKNNSRIEIKISEGKNRQIRKMCAAINKKVIALHRSKMGKIRVKDSKIGTCRYLGEDEINLLLKNR